MFFHRTFVHHSRRTFVHLDTVNLYTTIYKLLLNSYFLYIKILVSEQENIACDKTTKYHNLTVIKFQLECLDDKLCP